MTVPSILIALILALALVKCASEADATQCSTDTECEQMHGADE